MKKLLLTLAIAFFLFSCGDGKYYLVSITNGTTNKPVSYTYNGVSDTLPVSETRQYEVKAYTQPPKNIVDKNGIASLKMERNGDHYTFSDAPPLQLNVINSLPINITITADNYIDNDDSTELTINANTESTSAKIYTKSPKFTSTTNYPIIFEYTVVEDVMSVIIR